jgi:hypothetical protein
MLTPEQLQKLRDDNPKGVIHLVGKNNRWECVFRTPKRSTEFKPYKARCHNPAQVSDALEILARQIVVFPTHEAFDALLDDFPAIPEALSHDETFQELVGMSTEEVGK